MEERTIIFKPTYKCNLKCAYCYETEHRDAPNPKLIPPELAIIYLKKLINTAPQASWTVIWHGGEPTIVGINYFKQVLEYFDKTKYNIHWALQTNGTLINDEWLDILHKYGITIGTSWDGIDNDKSRDSRGFFDLLQRAQSKGVTVSTIHTLTRANCDNLVESFSLSLDRGFKVIYNTVFGIGMSIEDHKYIANQLVKVFDYICINENADLLRPFDAIVSYIEWAPSTYCETTSCTGGWFSINPDGDVFPCGKPWPQTAKYTNVLDKNFSLEEIQNSDSYKILTQARLQQLDDCKNCQFVLYCRGKCPFTGFDKDMNYKKDEAQCAYNYTFYTGCLDVLHEHLKNHTLINKKLIDSLYHTNNLEFKP